MSGSTTPGAGLVIIDQEPESTEDATQVRPIAAASQPDTSTLVHGVLWMGAARWGSQIIAWAVTLYMARILTDQEYGSAGLVAVATAWMFALTELGIGTALLALRDEGQRQVEALHSTVVGATLAGSVAIAIMAIPAARFVRDPALAPLLAIGGFVVVLQGLTVVPAALLQLKLDYRSVAQVEFLRAITNTLAVAVLALAGARVWSLPIGGMIAAVVQVVLLQRVSRVRFARPHRESLRPILAYARHVLAGRMAWNTYINADVVMVGRAASTAMAGQYQFAWNMATLPGEKLVNVVQAVMAPFFSALAHDRVAMRRYFLLLSEALAFLVFPVFVGIVVVADEAIPLLFGVKWSQAVLPLQLLIAYAMVQGVTSVVTHVANALRLARKTARVNLAAVLLLPPCFYVAAKYWGLAAVAAVWILAGPCMTALPLSLVMRALEIRLREYLSVFVTPLIASAAIVLSVLTVRHVVPRPASPALALTVDILAGAITYPAVMFVFFPKRTRQFRELLTSLRQRKAMTE